jgi:hypothetical protein
MAPMRRLATLLVILALATTVAQGATFFQYASQDGDPVGGGGQATIDGASTPFTVRMASPGWAVVQIGPTQWNFFFLAPTGQSLTVGTYSNVKASGDSTHPGMSIAASIACDATGSFTILELVRDASNNVVQFAADFEQHCSGYDPGLFGGVRINSSVPYQQQTPSYAGPAFIQWNSQPGDYEGGGTSGTLTRSDGYFVSVDQYANTARLMFQKFPSTHWEFLFQGDGSPIAVGTYTNALSAPNAPAGHPGLNVLIGSEGCVAAGSFTIYEIEYGVENEVRKLAADFVQYCNGSTTAALIGAVRFNSTIPYTAPTTIPPPPIIVPTSVTILSPVGFETIPHGYTAGPFVARAFDASNNGVPGAIVTFSVGACGSFDGQLSVDVMADASGTAISPQMLAGNSSTICPVTASVSGAAPGTNPTLPVYIYNPAAIHVTASPASINTPVNQGYSITFTAVTDLPVTPGISIDVGPENVVGAAAPAAALAGLVTDNTNSATVTVMANSQPGTYTIAAYAGSSKVSVPVIQTAAGMTTPPPPPPPSTPSTPQVSDVQSMWWVGPSENGWGMSLIQHNDTLFAALYIYDASGNPTWLVMPGGSWDSTHTIYSGSLYEATGTPFYAYDTTHFVPGSSKGSITLSFTDSDNATLDYTIGSSTGHKTITHETFGGDAIIGTDRTDLWWGGTSQNGWGITITQQGSTLFPIWYTYGANGSPMWYVMPGGSWTSPTTYSGTVYRTTGSPWIGATYDPTKLQVFSVGTFAITFNGEAATFSYTADGHSGTIPLVREPF